MMRTDPRRRCGIVVALCASFVLAAGHRTVAGPPKDIRPKHVTDGSLRAVNKGLEYLARMQAPNGSWQTTQDGSSYPTAMTSLAGMAFLANGNTTSRGPYSESVRKAVRFVVARQTPSGLITVGEELGRPMYGHGFSLLFLSCAYGMETDGKVREQIKQVLTKGIALTASGQSDAGGWIYWPGGGDEGSVTVTQMQGLRAAHEAGLTVPKQTIAKAVHYLEMCKQPNGGICYSLATQGEARPPISAAAICCLYSAGEYDSPLAKACLNYVWREMKPHLGAQLGGNWGHDFYMNLYAAQAFYQAGDKYWDEYFPPTRDELVKTQKTDGSWNADGIGPVFDTSVALIMLQLPYKFLPIYQR
jgi:prenyltransferase beta subunit